MLHDAILWPPPPVDWPLGLSQALSDPPPAPLPFPAQSPSPPPADEVHVWAAWLAPPPAALAEFGASLSSAEAERAARFRFERDRDRFVAGRGLLRRLLGRYLQTDPQAVEFTYSAEGKPALAGAFAASGLHFNLAHSEGLALLAVTRAGPVGIDVERIRALSDAAELVSRFFSARESAAFRLLPEDQKPAAFFSLWTRKEAWLKATGEGLAHLLARVEVSFLPGESARWLSLPERQAHDADWMLHELEPAPNFTGALAVAAPRPRLRCWRAKNI